MKTLKYENYIKQRAKDPIFKERYELRQQKIALASKIIEYRMDHKLSQGQLAQAVSKKWKIRFSQQYVSKIENGDFSSLDALNLLLHFTGEKLELRAVHSS